MYVRTYVGTYVRTYVRTYVVRTYVRTNVRTYIRMYVHMYVRSILADAQVPKRPGAPVCTPLVSVTIGGGRYRTSCQFFSYKIGYMYEIFYTRKNLYAYKNSTRIKSFMFVPSLGPEIGDRSGPDRTGSDRVGSAKPWYLIDAMAASIK